MHIKSTHHTKKKTPMLNRCFSSSHLVIIFLKKPSLRSTPIVVGRVVAYRGPAKAALNYGLVGGGAGTKRGERQNEQKKERKKERGRLTLTTHVGFLRKGPFSLCLSYSFLLSLNLSVIFFFLSFFLESLANVAWWCCPFLARRGIKDHAQAHTHKRASRKKKRKQNNVK